uniref:Uncharacterized protein n=1 Tax=Octopus bimaculoides TaxID=37653 RepID=A0A0L8GTG5_OCTBM
MVWSIVGFDDSPDLNLSGFSKVSTITSDTSTSIPLTEPFPPANVGPVNIIKRSNTVL